MCFFTMTLGRATNGHTWSQQHDYHIERRARWRSSDCMCLIYLRIGHHGRDNTTMSKVKGKSTLPESPDKWVCRECKKVTAIHLSAPNPFDNTDTIIGCPNCQSVDSLVSACWKCDREACIGTTASTEFRYVHSCHEHQP